VTSRTTISSRHSFQSAGHAHQLLGTSWGDTMQLLLAVTAFWDGSLLLLIQVNQSAARCFGPIGRRHG